MPRPSDGLRWRYSTAAGPVTVERARMDDAAALVEIHRAVIREGGFFITEPDELDDSVEARAAQIRLFSGMPNGVMLVARQGGALVGMASLQGGNLRRMRHCARLEIFVAREARGQGVGRALMEACVRWATENPLITKLALNVYAHNLRAIHLYESMGFLREGYRPGEYRDADGRYLDEVMMYRMVESQDQLPEAFR